MAGPIAYPVDIVVDAAGFHLVTFPDLPEAGTDDATRAGALREAIDCLEAVLANRIVDGKPIPKPSSACGRPVVAPSTRMAAKVVLYAAMRDQGVDANALSKRLGCEEDAVHRLLDPRLDTRLCDIEAALISLGKRLFVQVRDAA